MSKEKKNKKKKSKKKMGVGAGNHKNHYRTCTDKEIIAALKKSNGFLTAAANILGVTYQSVWVRMKRNPKILKKYEAIREKHLDFSENALLRKIKKGDIAAIIFHLKCLGKKRGYVERQEITGVPGHPIEHSVTVFSEKKLRNLSVDELQALVNIFEKVRNGNKAESTGSRFASVN